MKSHLQSYPCPLQINSFWNLGFLLGITIFLQIITGIFLGLHYTSDLNSAYSSLFFLIREIFYGWCLRYLHSSGASFVFLFLFLHFGRAISYGSYFYNPNTWFSGIIIFFFLMATAFMGYVLPFGQMSFWGATVITNLLSPFPSLIEWVCGGHYVYNPTLKRFFLFHFLFLHFYFWHLMAIAFMGYVLPFGQMSFWGATVITNLLSPFPSLIEWVCGGHYVYNPTLKRFFVFHFIFNFHLWTSSLKTVSLSVWSHVLHLWFHSNSLSISSSNSFRDLFFLTSR